MPIRRYLAMTAAEFAENTALPPFPAWMACHFSPYGRGLSNFPRALPPGALLMVDDITPIHGHDPARIAQQLADCVSQLECGGVLLDFQRPGYDEAAELARALVDSLPCPLGVSDGYADGLDCPVFLPPPPCDITLADYLAPWEGREMWLEMALDGAVLTVQENGTTVLPLPYPDPEKAGFSEESLHCHYKMELREDAAVFTLWRTREDLDSLLAEAEALGVTTAVGLYQELKDGAKHLL